MTLMATGRMALHLSPMRQIAISRIRLLGQPHLLRKPRSSLLPKAGPSYSLGLQRMRNCEI